MAGMDYRKCEQCHTRLYYEADIDYNNSTVLALCPTCAKEYRAVLLPTEILTDSALQYLSQEILDIESQLVQRKDEHHFHKMKMEEARKAIVQTKEELQRLHNQYNSLVVKKAKL